MVKEVCLIEINYPAAVEHNARQFGITKNNYSNEDKLLIDAFLLEMHHPLHQHDDDSFELFNALMNAKEGERMNIIKNNTHKDIIGTVAELVKIC